MTHYHDRTRAARFADIAEATAELYADCTLNLVNEINATPGGRFALQTTLGGELALVRFSGNDVHSAKVLRPVGCNRHGSEVGRADIGLDRLRGLPGDGIPVIPGDARGRKRTHAIGKRLEEINYSALYPPPPAPDPLGPAGRTSARRGRAR